MKETAQDLQRRWAAAQLACTPAMAFNDVVEAIPEAMSIQFNQRVYDLKRQGRDVITLSLGEAFFEIPLYDFSAVDYVKGYHYSDSRGLPELREKIAAYYERQYGVPVDAKTEILVSAGSKVLIYMAMLTALRAGEEVLVHEPCWLSYPEQARLCGAVPRVIPYPVKLEAFDRFFTERTRMLILNNPNNPAGRVYREQPLRELAQRCASRGVTLLVDEAYSDFVLDGSFASLGAMVPEKRHLVLVNSLSKNMGMSGWRIGYAIAPADFIQQLLKVQQHLITCAPTLLQSYCARYFEDILKVTLPQVEEVARKRMRMAARLKEIGLRCLGGEATFYFFVNIDPFPGTSLEFATTLLEEAAIAVVPGCAYGESTDRFIRVSIGTEPEQRIEEALWVIKKLSQSSRV